MLQQPRSEPCLRKLLLPGKLATVSLAHKQKLSAWVFLLLSIFLSDLLIWGGGVSSTNEKAYVGQLLS